MFYSSNGEQVMDEYGIKDALGQTKAQAEDIANKVHGAATDLFKQARDSGSRTAEAVADSAALVRDTPMSLEYALRNWIERQPYTAALFALGVGWLLGRSHRPI